MTSLQPGPREMNPRDKSGGARGPSIPALISAMGGAGSRATVRPSPAAADVQRAISRQAGDPTIRKSGY